MVLLLLYFFMCCFLSALILSLENHNCGLPRLSPRQHIFNSIIWRTSKHLSSQLLWKRKDMFFPRCPRHCLLTSHWLEYDHVPFYQWDGLGVFKYSDLSHITENRDHFFQIRYLRTENRLSK